LDGHVSATLFILKIFLSGILIDVRRLIVIKVISDEKKLTRLFILMFASDCILRLTMGG